MSKFHPGSFAFGVCSAVVLLATRKRLRPVLVELAALGVHLGRVGYALLERQREHVEDLWAELEHRARHKIEGRAAPPAQGGP